MTQYIRNQHIFLCHFDGASVWCSNLVVLTAARGDLYLAPGYFTSYRGRQLLGVSMKVKIYRRHYCRPHWQIKWFFSMFSDYMKAPCGAMVTAPSIWRMLTSGNRNNS
ncbi:hypothetical protein Pelo_823 [Pelomyxa schiedti]|nr:hypothetical protein Pelo_823 [Pelomyxa schiedti]